MKKEMAGQMEMMATIVSMNEKSNSKNTRRGEVMSMLQKIGS